MATQNRAYCNGQRRTAKRLRRYPTHHGLILMCHHHYNILQLSPVTQPYLPSFSTCLPSHNLVREVVKRCQNGIRSQEHRQPSALYKEITAKAISITAERSGHCVCASVHFADEPFQRGTGFKNAEKSKEWKSQEWLHIRKVSSWSKSPAHLGMHHH